MSANDDKCHHDRNILIAVVIILVCIVLLFCGYFYKLRTLKKLNSLIEQPIVRYHGQGMIFNDFGRKMSRMGRMGKWKLKWAK